MMGGLMEMNRAMAAVSTSSVVVEPTRQAYSTVIDDWGNTPSLSSLFKTAPRLPKYRRQRQWMTPPRNRRWEQQRARATTRRHAK